MQFDEHRKIKPLRGHIFVKVIEATEKTSGGIVLLDRSKPLPTESEVMALGDPPIERDREQPWPFKVGAKVFHNKFSGHSIKMAGDYYLILKAEHVLAYREEK